jgi:hypothetical protein
MDEQRYPNISIRMVGNGYVLTAEGGMGSYEAQWVARDIDEVCAVLHKVLSKPETPAA